MDNTTGSTPSPKPNQPGAPPMATKPAQPAQAAPAGAPIGAQAGAQAGAAAGAQHEDKSTTQMISETKHDIQSQAKSAVAAGKDRAVETIGGVAQSLKTAATQMRGQKQDGVAHYVDRAGQQIQSVADYLKNNDASQIVDKTEDFARRQPAVFLGAAFTLGVLGARFLKSSRRDEQQAQLSSDSALRRGTPASWNANPGGSTVPFDRERPIPGMHSTMPDDVLIADSERTNVDSPATLQGESTSAMPHSLDRERR